MRWRCIKRHSEVSTKTVSAQSKHIKISKKRSKLEKQFISSAKTASKSNIEPKSGTIRKRNILIRIGRPGSRISRMVECI
jgi:hypothetical protein